MTNSKEYSIVVETLKNLYSNKKIDVSKLKTMLSKKNITSEEYNYIIAKNN